MMDLDCYYFLQTAMEEIGANLTSDRTCVVVSVGPAGEVTLEFSPNISSVDDILYGALEFATVSSTLRPVSRIIIGASHQSGNLWTVKLDSQFTFRSPAIGDNMKVTVGHLKGLNVSIDIIASDKAASAPSEPQIIIIPTTVSIQSKTQGAGHARRKEELSSNLPMLSSVTTRAWDAEVRAIRAVKKAEDKLNVYKMATAVMAIIIQTFQPKAKNWTISNNFGFSIEYVEWLDAKGMDNKAATAAGFTISIGYSAN